MSHVPTDTQWADLASKISNGKIRTLTTASHNYPTDNPVGIAPWLLKPGVYIVSGSGVIVYNSATTTLAAVDGATLVIGNDSSSGYVDMIYSGLGTLTGFGMIRFNSTGGTYVINNASALARKNDIQRYITAGVNVTGSITIYDGYITASSTSISYSNLVTLFYNNYGNLTYNFNVSATTSAALGLEVGTYQFQCQKYTSANGFVATYIDPDTFNMHKLVHNSTGLVTITKSSIANYDTEEF